MLTSFIEFVPQTATNVAKMLDMAHKTFANAGRHTDAAKLLLVLSDGRGIFNEGQGDQNFQILLEFMCQKLQVCYNSESNNTNLQPVTSSAK